MNQQPNQREENNNVPNGHRGKILILVIRIIMYIYLIIEFTKIIKIDMLKISKELKKFSDMKKKIMFIF